MCIGLFDGVGSLRVALEALKAHVLLHVSCSEAAQRIVETHFPDSIRLDAVESITSCMCQEWAGRASGCSLVIVGAGVPLELHGMRNDREPITSLHALVEPVMRNCESTLLGVPSTFLKRQLSTWRFGNGLFTPVMLEYCLVVFARQRYLRVAESASTGLTGLWRLRPDARCTPPLTKVKMVH